MADHDGAYHRLFSVPRLVRELLTDVIKPPWLHELDLSTLERVNGKFHGEGLKAMGVRRREADVLWRVRRRDGQPAYIFLAIEFQSRSYWYMALRTASYTCFFYEHHIREGEMTRGKLPPIFPIVIYNGERRWSAPRSLRELIDVPLGSPFDDFIPNLRYYLVDELRFGADDLKAGSSILLNILRIEQSDGGWEAVESIEAIIKALDRDKDGSVIDAVADFLNTARLPLEGVEGDFHTILREDTMLLYKRARKWEARFKQEGLDQGRKQGLDQGRKQGLDQGRKQGLDQGRKQGLLQGKRDAIMQILNTRFGAVPSEIGEALKAVGGAEGLDALTTLAVTSPTLQEFQAELGA